MKHEINYFELFNNKEQLRAALLAALLEDRNLGTPEAVFLRNIIPDVARDVAYSGVPGDMINLISEEGELLCRGCAGECCKHSDPIGLTYNDSRRMANALNTSTKGFIKKYLKRNPDPEKIAKLPYALQITKPCQFLDADNRCKIYSARPHVCRLYPLMEEGGKIGLRLEPFCRASFNLHLLHAENIISLEIAQRRYI